MKILLEARNGRFVQNEVSGDLFEVTNGLISAIASTYDHLVQHDPETAANFRKSIERAVNDPDSPMWKMPGAGSGVLQ